MRGTKLLMLVALMGLLTVAPAVAEDFTGAEEQEEDLVCHYDGTPYPDTQEPPDEGECVDATKQRTYKGLKWDNDVECADGSLAPAGPLGVYAHGGSDVSGGIGVCQETSDLPIQGRFVLEGSMEEGGLHAYADGDQDNANETAQGWARADVTTGGPEVRCGDPEGRQDASAPTAADTQDDCG